MRWLKNNKPKLLFFTVIVIFIIVCLAKTLNFKSPLAYFYKHMTDERKNRNFIQGFQMVKDIKKDEPITEDMLEAVNCSIEQVPVQLQDILNSKARMSLSKGVLLTKSHLLSKKKLTDDMRIHNFPYIRLTDHMKKDDYIDIRISFANGGDFVLLSKKKIEDISYMDTEGTNGNALWLRVSEEELLRLSSAVVDAYVNEGCKIYAIQYISETQKEAIVNYTVNDVIKQLIEDNLNIVEKAENVMEWSLWEEHKKRNNFNQQETNVNSRQTTLKETEAYPPEMTETDVEYID